MKSKAINIIEERIKEIHNNKSLKTAYWLWLTDTEELIIEELEEIIQKLNNL